MHELSLPAQLHDLLTRNRAAATAEEASRALLEALLRVSRALLVPEEGVSLLGAALYRGSVRGWRGSTVLGEGKRAPPREPPSQTAWGLMLERREALLIYATHGRVGPAESAATGDQVEDPLWAESRPVSAGTRKLLSSGEATHIYGLPLLGSREHLEGMVTLEMRAPAEAGRGLAVWGRLGPTAQLLVDVAAPTLLGRPLDPAPPAQEELDFPVIGAVMSGVLATADEFAQSGGSMLLTGPTGAGKSRLARWIHDRSPRAKGPFKEVHLQNYDADKMMAYFFGWTHGSFTGAVREHPGEVAEAEGGTLFLDEIGLLNADSQQRLLLFLKERRYRRLGQTGPDRVADVRVIAATNEDLRARVAAHTFRHDLYLRIASRQLDIPGLDERADEIPGWAALMLQRAHAQEGGRGVATITPEAAALLQRRPWPGNLHALENAVGAARDLAARDAVEGALRVEARHVGRVLGLLDRGERPRPGDELRLAARAWMDAVDRGEEGLSWADAKGLFRSQLLLEAIRRHGLKGGFLALGEEERVSSGNHHKEHRLAKERVEAFERRGTTSK